jgi:hypothetical protein
MSITNNEAMDSVYDAMTMIDMNMVLRQSYMKAQDVREAKTLVSRLRETIKWIEIQVDGDWENEINKEDI